MEELEAQSTALTVVTSSDQDCATPSLSPPDSKTLRTINDLPVEILIQIFEHSVLFTCKHDDHRLAYWDEVDRMTRQRWMVPRNVYTRRDESADPRSPSLFPDALAAVCCLWRDALTLVSLFWTRIVVFVDDDPTPLSRLRTRLELSHEHPLDIIITRHLCSVTDSDPLEKRRVTDAMQVLYQHIARWRSLRINVLHTVSIPAPNIQMQGRAASLINLRLQSHIQMQGRAASPINLRLQSQMARKRFRPAGIAKLCFHAPGLTDLEIDGLTFRRSFLSIPQSIASVKRLVISRYSPGTQSRMLFTVRALAECLSALPHVDEVSLIDLDISSSVGAALPQPLAFTASFFHLEGLSSEVLQALFDLLDSDLNFLHLIRCAVPDSIDLGWASELHLQNLDTTESIAPLLLNWDSEVLYFHACPSFNSALLDEMAEEAEDGAWLCSTLEELSIYDCRRFNSGDIRRMVQARRMSHAEIGFADNAHPAFVVTSVLYLKVQNGPELAPKDREWFDCNVQSVWWNGWQGGHQEEW
ncbi:predicted protein [Sparassis crispa]|uniref:F-box domain-containing protein n=1 Tax=Sparassis crispa TaxID=139825 RepID=A0A401H0N6_9APHY|nr:predicted protein [Sparassis crispa]GBE87981.1 predicted protein [Sparassis crispa]